MEGVQVRQQLAIDATAVLDLTVYGLLHQVPGRTSKHLEIVCQWSGQAPCSLNREYELLYSTRLLQS